MWPLKRKTSGRREVRKRKVCGPHRLIDGDFARRLAGIGNRGGRTVRGVNAGNNPTITTRRRPLPALRPIPPPPARLRARVERRTSPRNGPAASHASMIRAVTLALQTGHMPWLGEPSGRL